MTEQHIYHPLHGVNLESLLTALVDHYGWEILAEQININCFRKFPSVQSSLKFLRKTDWARERLEAFYMYRFVQLPRPSDEQHCLPPRERVVSAAHAEKPPAVICSGDPEFFDDPASGPVYPNKGYADKKPAPVSRRAKNSDNDKHGSGTQAGADPWSKWRK